MPVEEFLPMANGLAFAGRVARRLSKANGPWSMWGRFVVRAEGATLIVTARDADVDQGTAVVRAVSAEIVEALESSNESVLSHRLNDVLRVLTAASVVLLPLTLIASVWGMNVHVPGEGNLAAFWIIVAAMAGVLVALILYFRRRGWL